jgi:hypothetical protein
MAVAIEDAGFEIRDQLGWTYGSGFRLTALETARLTTDDKARRARGADTPLFSGIDE